MTMTEHKPDRTLYAGLRFSESPRWHDGNFWCVDMYAGQVLRGTSAGELELVCVLEDDYPSGLGWLPGGELLVVAMESQQVRRVEPDGSVLLYADMSGLALGDCNDMVVSADGTVWLGDMAYAVHKEAFPTGPGQILRVSADGTVSVAAGNLVAPNGHVVSADGRTLIVAEAGGFRLVAFDIAAGGVLENRRLFAELTPEPGVDFAPPDGICLDAQGAVWFADPFGRRVCRVLAGGEVTDTVRLDDGAAPVACALGGPDRRTLFIAASKELPGHGTLPVGNARIDTLQVAIPGAGLP